ncbi:MAG: tricarballylate utilization 4Fe-4S protein TcuB [Betaproteobacteria bacterium]|nr:tricarballylate utilization 4Fe-4S protein TcuB [Betaproteobacteria bacterium]
MSAVITTTLPSKAAEEAARVMGICNSCRYCEGFCAVFPAMERRLAFSSADLHYLANLCHNCGACFHACQYAPPHEFKINVPRAMAEVRQETYVEHATPRAMGRLYSQQGMAIVSAALIGFVISLIAAVMTLKDSSRLFQSGGERGFYAVVPHEAMVAIFGSAFLLALLSMGISCLRFWWRIRAAGSSAALRAGDGMKTIGAVSTLRYLHGGGEGCPSGSDRPTSARRWLHHLVFYGFLLCFASTSVATIYHYLLGWPAPYPLLSLPVVLGTIGGLAMTIGCLGIYRDRYRRDRNLIAHDQKSMDLGFVTLLLAVAVTGLVLLAIRETSLMPIALIVHLASVMALFLLLPYSKFVHGLYRALALLYYYREKRQPNPFASSEA